jgi:hypothetical protein
VIHSVVWGKRWGSRRHLCHDQDVEATHPQDEKNADNPGNETKHEGIRENDPAHAADEMARRLALQGVLGAAWRIHIGCGKAMKRHSGVGTMTDESTRLASMLNVLFSLNILRAISDIPSLVTSDVQLPKHDLTVASRHNAHVEQKVQHTCS